MGDDMGDEKGKKDNNGHVIILSREQCLLFSVLLASMASSCLMHSHVHSDG